MTNFPQKSLKLLIEANVFPHIRYCLSEWGGANKTQLYRIKKVINFAARVVSGMKRSDRISPALQSLGWHRGEQMIKARDQVKVHKALHVDGCPPALRGMFTARSKVSVRITRASTAGELHVARCRLDRTKRSFRQRAAMTWNRPPKSATECSSLKMFKRALTGPSVCQ